MNNYELFLTNYAVINISNVEEYNEFSELMKKLGLTKIEHLDNILKKYGFEKGFCENAGIKYCEPKDVCFEYQIGKGFTYSTMQYYRNSRDEIKICSLDDLKIATDYAIRIDNKVFEKPYQQAVYYLKYKNEEEFKKFHGIDKLENQIKDISDYLPIEGYYDLRKYDLPEETFKELWRTQLYLKNYESNKSHIQLVIPDLWNRLKELSSIYQKELLSYPLKGQEEQELEKE